MANIPLRERLTQAHIDALRSRTRTNREVAEELQVNENYLSQVFNKISKRIAGPTTQLRKQTHKLVKSRKEMRQKEAKRYKNGEKTLKQAAKTAKCSERTILRYAKEHEQS